MSAWRVLIVEDDSGIRASLGELLTAAGWDVVALSRGTDAVKKYKDIKPDVILSDVRMPGMSGLDVLSHLSAEDPPLVLISAHGDISTAVDAMSSGAYSFIEKPYDPKRLLAVLAQAAEQFRIRTTNQRLRDRLRSLSGLDRLLLGQTEAMIELRSLITDIAETEASVLIQGETGTGKDLVSRAMHDLSPRSGQSFVPLNAAELTPENLLAALSEADGGTVFFDEIAATSVDVQALLLRVLETGSVRSPETGKEMTLDLRVVSATNQEPNDLVTEGKFRQDLLFRLNTMPIYLTPLRDRRDDIPLLVKYFLKETAELYEVGVPEITNDDLTALISHDWPGNVRELRNAVERRILMARRGHGTFLEALKPQDVFETIPDTLREAVAAFEKEIISKAIQSHQGRMDAVAEALGIGRRTLNEKIVKLGLDKDALL